LNHRLIIKFPAFLSKYLYGKRHLNHT